MTTGDLYSLLGVQPGATPEEIRSAYHQAARRFHPDANANARAAEEFKRIADAYAVLSDPRRRSDYDAAVAQRGSKPLLAIRASYSREALPVLSEPQVVYTLLEISPAIRGELSDPPLNLCLVIDRSTSMQGTRLEHVRGAVLHLIDSLREGDTFAVVAFSDRAEVVIPSQPSQLEKTVAKAKVSIISAMGGTEILQGLLTGLMELHRNLSPASVNHLLLLTDGRTYGDEADCLMLARLAATDGVMISGLGIGDEWNDDFLDRLTALTGGTAAYMDSTHNVGAFIRERVRGLSSVYAERLNARIVLDAGVELETVFKVSPEPGPVPIDDPLRLGTLDKERPASLLLKFRVSPTVAGEQGLARLSLDADVISVGRQAQRLVLDLHRPVIRGAPPPAPPPALVEALAQLSHYQMQGKISEELAAGDVDSAISRLRALGTRLLASGHPDLASLALGEASRIEQTHLMSEGAKKQLKYGTRSLLAVASPASLRP